MIGGKLMVTISLFQKENNMNQPRLLTTHRVNGLNDYLIIEVTDGPDSVGACHHYTISSKNSSDFDPCFISFQEGPIKEAGINGVSIEALLSICQDRLEGFQSGPFKTRENALALTHIQEAMHWLHHAKSSLYYNLPLPLH